MSTKGKNKPKGGRIARGHTGRPTVIIELRRGGSTERRRYAVAPSAWDDLDVPFAPQLAAS